MSATEKSFFWEFSHLDKVGFEAYLQLLSTQYPHELHIIQVDSAPAHNLDSSELPDNVILLFHPPACPEVNPTERVWEYLKYFLAWSVFSNFDEFRTKVQEILASFTDRVIGFLTGWSWILHSLSLSHLLKNGIICHINGDDGYTIVSYLYDRGKTMASTSLTFRCPDEVLEAIDNLGKERYPAANTKHGCDRSKTLIDIMRAGIEALNDGSVVLPPPEEVRQQPSSVRRKVSDTLLDKRITEIIERKTEPLRAALKAELKAELLGESAA